MTALPDTGATNIITDTAQLVDWFAAGCKHPGTLRVGTEHEKFVYDLKTGNPVPYEGARGIRAILDGLTAYGWEPVREHGNPIALVRGQAAVSLEPGGQLELSGAPLATLHETAAETRQHLEEVKAVCAPLGLNVLGVGFHPYWSRAEIPWMPKGRYASMGAYMPKRGQLGLDMMLRTCTIQVNLDYSSEADMAHKFRTSLALQPLATALFANSPFLEGKPNGFLSYRSHIWSDTDPQRTGMLPFVFDANFGYEQYVDYMLKVPMYFVYRDGKYIDASGLDFRDFLKGELSVLPGEKPLVSDWVDHMSTAFPEVRLKSFLEMRGADGGPWNRICARPAFWVGLLYDQNALDAAWDEVKHWTMEERETLRSAVPAQGLNAAIPGGGKLLDLAGRILDISSSGLAARNCLNASGDNETGYLDPLREIIASGKTIAEILLEKYHGEWNGDVSRVYDEMSF